jgi:hypothetical protein
MKSNFERCIIGDVWESSYEFESVVDYSKTDITVLKGVDPIYDNEV